jgi:hypothetical protein
MLQDNDRNKLGRHARRPSLQEQEKNGGAGFNAVEATADSLRNGRGCRAFECSGEARRASAMKPTFEGLMERSKKCDEALRAGSSIFNGLLIDATFARILCLIL